MSDEVDQANDIAEATAARRIQSIRNEPPAAMPTGFCLECDDPVESGHRWCSPECRDMWSKRNDK